MRSYFKTQCEEATWYKPVRKTDNWDRLSLDERRWLVKMRGPRVQRFHPEHRSCPVWVEDLEFMRATCAWKGDNWHCIVIVDSWRCAEFGDGPGQWVGLSFFLLKNEQTRQSVIRGECGSRIDPREIEKCTMYTAPRHA